MNGISPVDHLVRQAKDVHGPSSPQYFLRLKYVLYKSTVTVPWVIIDKLLFAPHMCDTISLGTYKPH